MERTVLKKLESWKNSASRKPLILTGARQVGKTYILKEFGKRFYKNVAYINCDAETQAKDLFVDYNIERIILHISAITKQSIIPGETLIIFDEIQEIPRGISVLKYFNENAPQYHVAVAGSLLGIAMHPGESFPVGQVNFIDMFPMTFEEFLVANGNQLLLEQLQLHHWDVISSLHNKLVELLRNYMFVGGMPEAVRTYIETNDANAVRTVQNNILKTYQNDMSKHAPKNQVPRINQVWQSIPSQLAKENKKFIYGAIKKGARASDFEIAIQWLIDAGLIYRIPRASKPYVPLKFYEDMSAFKLYMLDCGLFAAMSDIDPSLILLNNNIFSQYKGSFTENFVLTQLTPLKGHSIYYFSNNESSVEIDFLFQDKTKVIPIEIKAEENVKSKSLHTFVNKYSPLKGLRFSMKPYRDQEWMENAPLYAVTSWFKEVY